MKEKMLLHFSLTSSAPCSLPSSLAVFFIFGLGSTDWLGARACRVTLGTAANACEPAPHGPAAPVLLCQRWRGRGGWRATLLSPVARVPWERARGARVLMLSDLVKSRVTALLPGWEVGGGWKELGRMGGVKGICFPSNTQTSNINPHKQEQAAKDT